MAINVVDIFSDPTAIAPPLGWTLRTVYEFPDCMEHHYVFHRTQWERRNEVTALSLPDDLPLEQRVRAIAVHLKMQG